MCSVFCMSSTAVCQVLTTSLVTSRSMSCAMSQRQYGTMSSIHAYAYTPAYTHHIHADDDECQMGFLSKHSQCPI